MKMKSLILILLVLSALLIRAQEKPDESKFGIKFSGFVKTDIFYDTRQTISIREGHFSLYPASEKLDINGVDINAKDHVNILAIQSRITGKISGPDALGAKTSALIEADFFGNENGNFADVNGFRLRHAFIKLNWTNTELLVGQFWHPLFAHECFPDVVSFNTGAPFQPFARHPQIRLTQKLNRVSLILAVAEQRDFTSTGPDGGNSKYLNNEVLPDLNMHWQYKGNWGESNTLLLGAGVEFKTLVPRLSFAFDQNSGDGVDSTYFAGDNKVSSFALSMYSKVTTPKITWKAQMVYGGNMFEFAMLGGYAVSATPSPSQLKYEYTPTKILAVWSEIATKGKIQAGLFGGFTRNLGSLDDNVGVYYSRGANINQVYRISPRIVGNFEKLRISTEFEFTVAEYGTADSKGRVNDNLSTVSNLRLLLAFYYFF
ncbi:MAG: hypothetical protein PF694_04805 [Bacteroidetes bacterium]|jgi:hypothetical protein|nr:hypothetical protein [Bacteroidota bacterium]